jgi:cation-transporting P-type ATPase E
VRVFAFVILMTATVLPGLLFPISIKHNAILTLLTEGIPTLGITIWAQPGQQKTNRGLIQSILPFVVPAMALLALFSLLVYLGFVIQKATPLLKLVDQTMSLEQIQQIITRDLLANALLLAQNALIAFLVFSGLLLILLLKPPSRFWTGGAPLSGDLRYSWMALAMLIVYGVLLAVPGLRSIFDLRLLNPLDYLIIALLAFLWALLTRYAWRNRWLERFLEIDQAPLA